MDVWMLVGVWLTFLLSVGSLILMWLYPSRAARREMERRDIVWKARQTDAGYVFSHDSEHPARDILIVLTIDGVTETLRETSRDVNRDDEVLVPHTEHTERFENLIELKKQYNADLNEYEKKRNDPRNNTFGEIWLTAPQEPMSFPVPIDAVIVWTYPSGVSGRQQLSLKVYY